MAWTSSVIGARRLRRRLRLALALLPARRRVHRLEARLAREVPRPERVLLAVPADLRHHAGDLAHGQLAHVLTAAVLLVDLVDLLPARALVDEVDGRRVAAEPAGAAVGLLLRLQPRLVRVGAVARRDHLRHEAGALGVV